MNRGSKGLAALVVLMLGGAATEVRAAAFNWPVSGPISQGYFGSGGLHHAIDIAVPTGTPVVTARGGSIGFQGWGGGYGNLCIVNHGSGYQTYYGHNSRFGNGFLGIVAFSGSTGNSTGPHVHFEIRRWGSLQYIPGNPGWYVRRGDGIPQGYPGL